MSCGRIACPACQTMLRVTEGDEDRRVRCPKCKEVFSLASVAQLSQAERSVQVRRSQQIHGRRRLRDEDEELRGEEEQRRPRRRRRVPSKKKPRSVLPVVLGVVTGCLVLCGVGVKVANVLVRQLDVEGESPVVVSRAANLDLPRDPATWPALGPARNVAAGVTRQKVLLRPGDRSSEVWVYLPEGVTGKLPCVLVAPAGSPLIVGNTLGEDDSKEHLPYVQAGFAVVAYALSGPCENIERATGTQVVAAATAFLKADAGVRNAQQALDYVLAQVPVIDSQRIYTAGHSSAATLSLQLAQRERRIAGCVAYAPCTDLRTRLASLPSALTNKIPGYQQFLNDFSPLAQADKLRCPLFLFHAEDDDNVPIAESARFVAEVQKTSSNVTFFRAAGGGHYESMIEQGIPRAIGWLKGMQGK